METTKYKFLHIKSTPAKPQLTIYGEIAMTGTISSIIEEGFFSNEIIAIENEMGVFAMRLNQN